MAKGSTINQEGFEKFLSWLDKDREIAGQKYEEIRLRLIKIFYARGCYLAEELADESVDRVIKKCDELIKTYEGDPALYCYGVAQKVFLEFTRRPKTEELPDTIVQEKIDVEELAPEYKCLNKCLKKLKPDQQKLILDYYKGEKQTKIERRKELEKKLKITNQSLRVRALRIRKILQKCIQNCLEQGSNQTFK
jgi:DNA-directed RNA polymerase specialized sigma24 family protein